jgi:hypothetical protein
LTLPQTSMTSESLHLTSSLDAPQYILVSHTFLSTTSSTEPTHSTLSHPTIQYVYADDGPEAALPRFPGEQVIILDVNGTGDATHVTARSLVPEIAVVGLRSSVAPGADAVDVNAPIGGNKMYVIDTVHVAEARCEIMMTSTILSHSYTTEYPTGIVLTVMQPTTLVPDLHSTCRGGPNVPSPSDANTPVLCRNNMIRSVLDNRPSVIAGEIMSPHADPTSSTLLQQGQEPSFPFV